MSNYTAFFDASVLYSAPLRDFLLRLALKDLFHVKWSQMVIDEWISALLKKRPDLKRKNLERTSILMNSYIRDALISDFEDLIEILSLPDPNDRHVLAAAIKGRADVIVTANLKDFPNNILTQYGLEAQHPDEFIVHLIDLYPDIVVESAREQRADLLNPPKTAGEFLLSLESAGLTQTVVELKAFISVI